MAICLDHLIVRVNDLDETLAFWTRHLGLRAEAREGPFAVGRVTSELTIQFAPWTTEGNEHFAFAMEPDEFAEAFERLRAAGVPYGDSFHSVGNMQGPGRESGARGTGWSIYFTDPNNHLLEIRTYSETRPEV